MYSKVCQTVEFDLARPKIDTVQNRQAKIIIQSFSFELSYFCQNDDFWEKTFHKQWWKKVFENTDWYLNITLAFLYWVIILSQLKIELQLSTVLSQNLRFYSVNENNRDIWTQMQECIEVKCFDAYCDEDDHHWNSGQVFQN